MRDRRASIAWVALLASLAAGGCPASGGGAPGGPSRELSEAVREIEALRAEKRDQTLKSRELARARDALEAELGRARAREAEARKSGEGDLRAARARVAELEEQLAAAQGRADAEAADPGPEALRKVFLTAVRRRDRAAVESLVDWEAFLEAALRGTAESESGGERAMAEFRALPEAARKERLGKARDEFLAFLFGEEGPRLDNSDTPGDWNFLRSRIRDSSQRPWDVLLRKSGSGWKVVGMSRQPSPSEPSSGEGEEKGE